MHRRKPSGRSNTIQLVGSSPVGIELPNTWFLVSPPRPRDCALLRRRLSHAFEEAVEEVFVTIVEAPPGFGKTTALAAWVRQRPQRESLWLSLTSHDSTSSQLIAGILFVLRRAYPDDRALRVAASLWSQGASPWNQILHVIVETLERQPNPTVLVIDDAHYLGDQESADVIEVLTRLTDGQLRVVVAGTHSIGSLFTKPLVEQRARRIDAQFLSLTQAEAHELAKNQSVDPGFEADVVTRLWRETQGWPAAFQLALKNSQPRGEGSQLRPNVSEDVLTDYVEQHVLSRLQPELRDFILKATTCDRVTVKLATHLSGSQHASALLTECRRQGLFLDYFGESGSEDVYQWHAMFARHCRAIHRRTDHETARTCHRLAAVAIAEVLPQEAVSHALEIGDAQLAAVVLEENWLPMITEGHAAMLAENCLRLPDPWPESPSLLFIRAACRDVEGDHLGASILATRAAANTRRIGSEPDDALRATSAFASLLLAETNDSLKSAADDAWDVLHNVSLTSTQYSYGTFLLGWAEMRLRREPSRAVNLLTTAKNNARQAGRTVLAGRATANLAFALAFEGHLSLAQTVLDDLSPSGSMAVGEWAYYDGGVDVMAAVLIAFWRHDLPTVIDLTRQLSQLDGHDASYAALARIFFALAATGLQDQSLTAEANVMLLRVSDVERNGVPWPAYKSIAKAQLEFLNGNSAGVLAQIAELRKYPTVPIATVMAAELCSRMGDLEQATEWLRRIERPESVAPVYVWKQFIIAAIAWNQGNQRAAHLALERSLHVAVSEDIVRPFAILDEPSRRLLTNHAAWGTQFEQFIASRLDCNAQKNTRSARLAEPLSRRERQIFAYLSTRMTAQEIAVVLHVSVNTVRSHQRAIYRKLGVKSRRDAVRVRL